MSDHRACPLHSTDPLDARDRSPVPMGEAFVAEVRHQWAEAEAQLQSAIAALDDWGQSLARGRLADLEDILGRHGIVLGAALRP